MKKGYDLSRYTIDKAVASLGGVWITYDGNKSCWAKDHELNGFKPKKGMRIAVGLINETVKTIVINGNKIR